MKMKYYLQNRIRNLDMSVRSASSPSFLPSLRSCNIGFSVLRAKVWPKKLNFSEGDHGLTEFFVSQSFFHDFYSQNTLLRFDIVSVPKLKQNDGKFDVVWNDHWMLRRHRRRRNKTRHMTNEAFQTVQTVSISREADHHLPMLTL